MAHRKPLIEAANDVSALVLMQCRGEVAPRVHRMQVAQLVMSEFAEMAARVERSISEHGEVTERTYRYLRENVRDLAVSVLGRTDVPNLAGESAMVAAD